MRREARRIHLDSMRTHDRVGLSILSVQSPSLKAIESPRVLCSAWLKDAASAGSPNSGLPLLFEKRQSSGHFSRQLALNGVPSFYPSKLPQHGKCCCLSIATAQVGVACCAFVAPSKARLGRLPSLTIMWELCHVHAGEGALSGLSLL